MKQKIVLLLISLMSFNLLAQVEEDHISYEGILSELSASNRSTFAPVSEDPFSSLLIHGGLGLVSSYVSVAPSGGKSYAGLLTGVEASFGIDLFSRTWLAEGSLRSFGNENFAKDLKVGLREFDLKLVYRNPISSKLMARFGGGLSARYLDVAGPAIQNGGFVQTTPTSVLTTGLHAYLSRAISIGADVSYRSPLIDETLERASVDGTLKLDAHF